MDVTDAAGIARGFEDAEAAIGSINCLVNNAGIATGVGALDLSVGDYDAVMDTNARGAFLVAQQAARSMNAAGQGGRIVNIASVLGLRVASAVTPYAMSKAAVIQMTHALALEWARHGIRVNALAPGYVETEISSGFLETEAGKATVRRVPMRRIVRIEELDAPFLLLAGNASSAMTGVVLPVDCGHLVSTL
jgi:NAD(P)-dependent dehydrogenase (short-subunit alcohol dehydrogenase family)